MKDSPNELAGAPNGFQIAKAPTGIRGVDEILFGGMPRGRTTLVAGGPGTGKTVFGLESLYRAALAGEPGIFVTFEEQAEAIRRNARAMGWDFAPLERDGKLLFIDAEVPTDLVQSGEFDIGGLLAILAGQIKALGARRLVIDAVDALLWIFRESHRREEQLLTLHDWLRQNGQTALLTMKNGREEPRARLNFEYMADCVVLLDQRIIGQVATRRLRVLKYRGSGFLSNEYPYIITSGGIVLLPISSVELSQQPFGPKFSTGISGLDPLLSGGFSRGSCILIGGASGTGKTTLACSIATAACSGGERVLYVSFEDSREGLVSMMRSPGLDLGQQLEARRLQVLTAMPEAKGVEEHLWRILQAIDAHKPQHLVLDSISACHRMGSEEAAFDFLVRLLMHCKARGLTCLFVNQTGPAQPIHEISGIGISSLVDTLVVLEQDWPDESHRRRLLIVKVRGSPHSHIYHNFQITGQGIQVDDAAPAPSVRQEQRL